MGGVAFGVNPIGPLPETYVGYKIGPVVPYLSLSFFNHSGRYEDYYERYDEDEFDTTYYEYADTVNWSGSVLAPTLGTKFVFGTTDLKPFVRVSGSMPFLLSVNVEINDDDDQEYIDSLITDFKQDLKPIFMFTFGAGVEYFFAEQFSIGGEFNYRLLTGGWEYDYYDEWESEYYDPIEDTTYYFQHWRREEYNVGGSIGGTCAGLWLNYYF
jgi:hypothetical protein